MPSASDYIGNFTRRGGIQFPVHANRTRALKESVFPGFPMNAIRNASLFTICLFAGTAWAQNVNPPLNLQLPPSDLPAVASTSANHPASHPATDRNGNPSSAPGVY